MRAQTIKATMFFQMASVKALRCKTLASQRNGAKASPKIFKSEAATRVRVDKANVRPAMPATVWTIMLERVLCWSTQSMILPIVLLIMSARLLRVGANFSPSVANNCVNVPWRLSMELARVCIIRFILA